ncbi:MAG: DUF2975 domain-containing protein [Pseudomonadota bacterium]
MTRRLSLLVSWGCLALLVLIPAGLLFGLVRLDLFAELAQNSVRLAIQWRTVVDWQLYALWLATALYLSIGLVGLAFLRRAFANFADGELFNVANSRDLRRFAVLLLIQAVATPVHGAVTSVLLSMNHPGGQKILSIGFGSPELKATGVALVLWVMSELLVEGSRLQSENRQFV